MILLPKLPPLLLLFASPLATAANLVGSWEFGNASNLGEASTGAALKLNGSITAATGLDGSDGAADVSRGAYLTVTNPIGANGSGSPSRSNRFTIVVDFKIPDFTDGGADNGNFTGLFEFSGGGDGDYFIRKQGTTELGVAAVGYAGASGTFRADTWYRLVYTVDSGGSGRSTYLDGTLVGTHNANNTLDYARGSLGTSFGVFQDDTLSEQSRAIVSTIALFDGPLSAPEVAALGSAGNPLAAGNQAPAISEGASIPLIADYNGPAVELDLHATDAESDAVTWSIASPPAIGSASILSQSSATCTLSFTPAAGQSGIDPFVVRASDAEGFSEITVNAAIVDAPADPKIFYQENFDDALLLPEVTTSGQRRMPAGDNTPVWNNADDAGLGLSRGPDLFLNSTASRVVEFEGFNLMRTDFWRNGDDQGRSTAFAPGANVIAVADSDEFPDAGGGSIEDEFNVFLRSPVFQIPDDPTSESMELSFLSSFRREENETSRVLVYYDGSSTPSVTLDVPGSGAAAASVVRFSWAELGSPAPGSLMQLEFAHEDADNNWWWAIDEVFVGIPNQAPLIDEAPVLSAGVAMGSSLLLDFHASDPDGDPLTWGIGSAPAHGSASIQSSDTSNCSILYTPQAAYTGTDSFEVTVTDGTSVTTVTVNLSITNTPPVILEGETYQLAATTNGGPRTATFTATDPNGNPLAWSIGSASHGTATIISSDSGSCTVSYTPDTGYSGADSFTVEVSDGLASDRITVQVNVTDPTADPVLTIVSPVGTSNPAAGSYPHPAGTSLSPTASNELGSDTRHLCTGWTMSGDGPASGTGNSFTFTLTRDSTLTWRWRTEHRVETAVSGNGSIDLESGWQDASRPLQITATADPGHHFAGWTGDTTGCVSGGSTIVLPMDRAYGTITAQFVADENFSVIALPDTQNYTSLSSPADTFTRQTQWVLDNRETLNIRFLTHLGDIVNSPTSTSQWTRATDAMNLLNHELAYGTCPGNHDIGSRDQPGSGTPSDYLIRFGPNPTHASSVGRWTDPDTSQVYDWYRGSSPRGYSSYQIVPVGGREFLFLHLDHDCPDEDMAWAASVLSAHPRTLTMITTHNYLAETGGTGFFGTGTGERGYTAQPNVSIGPDRNRPEEIFNALVKPFNQVYMVICGHMFAIYNLEKTNDAGNPVHEVLCDYQSLPNGGNGFLRIMEFRPGENRILNTTYSPTLGRYIDPNLPADRQGMLDLHDPNGGEFELGLDFEHRFDSTLTIASAYPDVTPAPGPHRIADGSPVVVSADVQLLGNTRERPVGWTLTGAQSLSGTGGTATFTHEGNATLSWSWATEHYLETSVTGNGIVSVPSGWQSAGASVPILAQPDPGASFLAWSGDIDGCSIDGERITVPMDRPRGPVTATFSSAVPSFAVTVVSDYASSPAAATYTYEQGSEVTFSAPDTTGSGSRHRSTGYSLSGALNGSGTENSVTLTITGDFTLTWNWATEYQVLAAASGPGSVSPTSTWVPAGDPLVLTATPDEGAAFTSWSGDIADGSAAGSTFTLSSVDRPIDTITANFALGMHTLTIVSAQDSVMPPPGSISLPVGSLVEFSALPSLAGMTREVAAGWTLTGATSNSGTTDTGTFTLNGDTTLTWSWDSEVYLELAAGLEGRIQALDAAGWKALGSSVDLNAVPAAGFSFVRWTGDVPADSTSPALTLTMDQPRIVAADLTPAATAAGTPHWWLDAHATVIGGDYEAAELSDSDGDGQIARDEFVAGTDDLDPARRFQVETLAHGNPLVLAWQSDIHRNYVIRSSPDLASPFGNPTDPVAGNWPLTSFEIPLGNESRRFFQVEALLAPGTALDGDSPALSPAPAPGSLLREMRRVPAGWFTLGDDGGVQTSAPAHLAYVPAFDMDRFEVTRAEWETVVTWATAHGYDLPYTLRYDVPGDHPTVAVSWYDAVKWCNARSEMEGRVPAYRTDVGGATVYRTGSIDLTAAQVNWSGNGYRLPTEAEWERASRGGLEGKPYPWGDADALLLANHWNYELEVGVAPSEEYPYTTAVGLFGEAAENAYGLHDMVGNAWEWTWDRMDYYSAEPQIQPRGPDQGEFRVLRGGSWWNYVDQATNSQRLAYPPAGNDDYGMLGFRCVRGLHPNE
ncbi:SUMF1/EgtB/PvdO family nonheme iron enzyme [Luteolibacter marinus]|uniref:SUMF1/EgtB/PvdO family nonheme iron enzyme n=1 Tax=Luteolibacter marinus TaxID=2776705 RepID=UPI001867A748|nr:SUMF1/EgtB/PvdO family nonheme iron enzyme [Luteolibacter marinus]